MKNMILTSCGFSIRNFDGGPWDSHDLQGGPLPVINGVITLSVGL